tara:strand:- start:1574 stop:1828 length:255 start_codon:yes stop_codon:yes gene_type:complete
MYLYGNSSTIIGGPSFSEIYDQDVVLNFRTGTSNRSTYFVICITENDFGELAKRMITSDSDAAMKAFANAQLEYLEKKQSKDIC